jgi:hypothetical protein
MEEAGKQYRTILPQDPKWNKNAKINREKKRPQTPYFHQPRVSPQARVLLGLDSPQPLSACGKFYQSGDLPEALIGGKQSRRK